VSSERHTDIPIQPTAPPQALQQTS